METPVIIEIAFGIAAQIATTAMFLGGLRSDVKNLIGWVKALQTDQQHTHDLALTTAGRVDALEALLHSLRPHP